MIDISRRQLLLGALGVLGVGATGAAVGAGLSHHPEDLGLALVYRGPASCAGCSEAVANLLASGNNPLRIQYCGPDEAVDVTAASLAGAQVYAQPGGGSLLSAWRHTREYAPALRDYAASGGNYLGFCLGAYLAGGDPGYGLFPGNVRQYIGTSSATIADTSSTVVGLDWRDEPRHLYFQDGAAFTVPNGDWAAADAQVLARYRNGAVAAVVAPYGNGRAGLVGPHPEADEIWYRNANLRNPDGVRFDLGYDLIGATLSR